METERTRLPLQANAVLRSDKNFATADKLIIFASAPSLSSGPNRENYLRIRNVPHRPVPQKNHHQGAVPQHPDDEYEKKEDRNEVRFRTFSVRNVLRRAGILEGLVQHERIAQISRRR